MGIHSGTLFQTNKNKAYLLKLVLKSYLCIQIRIKLSCYSRNSQIDLEKWSDLYLHRGVCYMDTIFVKTQQTHT